VSRDYETEMVGIFILGCQADGQAYPFARGQIDVIFPTERNFSSGVASRSGMPDLVPTPY